MSEQREAIAVVSPTYRLAVHWFKVLCKELDEHGKKWHARQSNMHVANDTDGEDYYFYILYNESEVYRMAGTRFDKIAYVGDELFEPGVMTAATRYLKLGGETFTWTDRRERLRAEIEHRIVTGHLTNMPSVEALPAIHLERDSGEEL